jgi:HEAT repeat protein
MVWRGLFTRNNDPPLREEEIRKIAGDDSILGWTASNVIKRFKLTDPDLRQLRGVYDAADAIQTQLGNAIKWRVVHALGRFDTIENADLLFRALDDESHLVQFGAARSLVEMAAITQSIDLRQRIVEGLQSRIGRLRRRTLEEIGNAVFYRNAPASWRDLIVTLLEKIRDSQRETKDREEFDKVLNQFKQPVENDRDNSITS